MEFSRTAIYVWGNKNMKQLTLIANRILIIFPQSRFKHLLIAVSGSDIFYDIRKKST